MSSEQPRRGREGSSSSPMGSTAAIIIAVVAVVAGFLILRSIRDDDGGDAGDGTVISGVATTLAPTDETTAVVSVAPTSEVTTTTAFVPVTTGAKVVVANASTVNQVAGALTTALSGAGFELGEPTNSTTKIDVSTVHFDAADPEAESVARSVAALMGVADVAAIPVPAPVEGGVLEEGTGVLVLLGNDKAGQTLEQMGQGGTTETTVAGAATTVAAETTVAAATTAAP